MASWPCCSASRENNEYSICRDASGWTALPRFQSGNVEKNLQLRSLLKTVAGKKNATLAQLAIAWTIAQGARAGATVVPIPGAKSRKHLEENVRAMDVRLTADDLAEIDRIASPGAAAGTRYPLAQMRRLNV